MVKENAPALLEAELSSPKWEPQIVVLSGVTDPYQPVERRLKITRRCLEVLAKFRNPVGIITKNRLVTRDIDIFRELAAHDAVAVNVSVTSLDRKVTARPRAAHVAAASATRCDRATTRGRDSGGVMVAPIVPGITDHEVPAILAACAKAGAQFAGYVVLRLPWAVAPLFERWLSGTFSRTEREGARSLARSARRRPSLRCAMWKTPDRRGDFRGTDRGDVSRGLSARGLRRTTEAFDRGLPSESGAVEAL